MPEPWTVRLFANVTLPLLAIVTAVVLLVASRMDPASRVANVRAPVPRWVRFVVPADPFRAIWKPKGLVSSETQFSVGFRLPVPDVPPKLRFSRARGTYLASEYVFVISVLPESASTTVAADVTLPVKAPVDETTREGTETLPAETDSPFDTVMLAKLDVPFVLVTEPRSVMSPFPAVPTVKRAVSAVPVLRYTLNPPSLEIHTLLVSYPTAFLRLERISLDPAVAAEMLGAAVPEENVILFPDADRVKLPASCVATPNEAREEVTENADPIVSELDPLKSAAETVAVAARDPVTLVPTPIATEELFTVNTDPTESDVDRVALTKLLVPLWLVRLPKNTASPLPALATVRSVEMAPPKPVFRYSLKPPTDVSHTLEASVPTAFWYPFSSTCVPALAPLVDGAARFAVSLPKSIRDPRVEKTRLLLRFKLVIVAVVMPSVPTVRLEIVDAVEPVMTTRFAMVTIPVESMDRRV